MISVDNQLWGLFISAFVSSTLLPGGSELAFGWLHQQDQHPAWLLLAIATIGNTLGGLTSYLVGRIINTRMASERMQKPSLLKAHHWLQCHGSPILLLSWLPIIGDPLCVAAGWLRINIGLAALFIATGKGLRYTAILLVT